MNIEPGTKKFEYMEVPGAATERTFVNNPLIGPPRPRKSEFPVMYINGSAEGEHLCVIAGTHACEYPSIDAAIRTFQQIDANELTGRITIIPVLNIAAFWTRTPYINPLDGIDIGATFGNEGSSISYLIGEIVLKEIISQSDFIVDLHGGDVIEDIAPHAGFSRTGDEEMDEKAQNLAKLFGADFIFERLGKDATKKFDIPRIIAEAGREGKLEKKYTEIHMKGILNILKGLDMIKGEPDLPSKQKVMHGRYEIFAEKAGLFASNVEVGDPIQKSEVLGRIRNLKGEVVEEITAKKDGVVQLITTNPVKQADDLVYKCWMP